MPTPRQHVNPAARQAAYRARLVQARQEEQEDQRVPALPAVTSLPGAARWRGLSRHAVLLLQRVQEEMQAYYDQRSERWQESERGDAFCERLEALEELQQAAAELWR